MSDSWSEHVLPHGPLEEVVPGLWSVQGTLSRQPLPRNMAVHRMADGGLWLHSVIALDEPQRQALEALGPVTWIVVPLLHVLGELDEASAAVDRAVPELLAELGGAAVLEGHPHRRHAPQGVHRRKRRQAVSGGTGGVAGRAVDTVEGAEPGDAEDVGPAGVGLQRGVPRGVAVHAAGMLADGVDVGEGVESLLPRCDPLRRLQGG